jgi:hypothetical protein
MSGVQVTLSALVIALASVAGGFAASAVETSGVVVSYDAPSAIVLHEPVIVEVRLSNESSDSVHFDLGFNRQAGFTLTVKSPDGAVRSPRIVKSGLGRSGRLVLRPKEKISHQLLLNDWLPFDQVGAYEISIALSEPIRTQNGTLVETPTATEFRLNVGPHDRSELEAICRRLTDTIIGSRLAEERMNSARALSWIADPVVLPFIEEIMSVTDNVDYLLVEGLARMKHVEARRLLTEMAQSYEDERAALGRDALGGLRVHPDKKMVCGQGSKNSVHRDPNHMTSRPERKPMPQAATPAAARATTMTLHGRRSASTRVRT